MKNLLILLAALGMFSAAASAEEPTPNFVGAYELQEACFRGAAANTEEGKSEVQQCVGYVAGVVDFVYAASPCHVKVTLEEVLLQLQNMYGQTPDEDLIGLSAAYTVFGAFSRTEGGIACFGGAEI